MNPFSNLRQIDEITKAKSSFIPKSKNPISLVGSYQTANVEIVTNKPIGLVFSGDWHLGAKDTDHSALADLLELVYRNPSLYLFLMGDLYENCKTFYSLESIHSQTINPESQFYALEQALTPLIERTKILGSIHGNHDIERDEKLFSYSPLAQLLKKNVPYFDGKAVMNLVIKSARVGEPFEIKIFANHKSSNSAVNPFAGPLKLYDKFFHADIVCTAHVHNPVIGSYVDPRTGKAPILLQTGTFKTGDDVYSLRHFKRGLPGCPTVVIDPNQKELVPFMNPNQALNYLK